MAHSQTTGPPLTGPAAALGDRTARALEASPRVAVVFDHWYTPGGAQNEVRTLLEMFPGAPLFTLMRARDADWDETREMRVSFLDRLPLAHSRPSLYLPLMPAAIESFDFREFDVVISVVGTWAKGAITQLPTVHLCRAWVPMRYGWECYHEFMASALPRERSCWLARKLRGYVMSSLRVWDVATANRVDQFVAGSQFVAGILRRRYRRDAIVVYPPVDTDYFVPTGRARADYYLIVSRLMAYKRVDLAVQAFNQLGLPLTVVGDGDQLPALRRMARPNITFVGKLAEAQRPLLRELLQHCRAFIMPQTEDFGIAAVEAMACGRPVVAYARGGALESLRDGETGVLFAAQEVESVQAAVRRLEEHEWDGPTIRRSAERFRPERFRQGMIGAIEAARHGVLAGSAAVGAAASAGRSVR